MESAIKHNYALHSRAVVGFAWSVLESPYFSERNGFSQKLNRKYMKVVFEMLPEDVKPYSESYQWLWKNRASYQTFRFNVMNMWVPDEPKRGKK